MLTQSWPGVSGKAQALDIRQAVAGMVLRPGVMPGPNDPATPLLNKTTTMTPTLREFNLAYRRNATDGIQLFYNDGPTQAANEMPAFAAAPATGSRMDILYVKSFDPAYDDASLGTSPRYLIAQGDATTGTAQPRRDRILPGGFELGTLLLPAGATTLQSANVVWTDTYQFGALRGGLVIFRNAAEMNAGVTAKFMPYGQECMNLETLQTYVLGRVDGAPRLAERGTNLFGSSQTFPGGTIVNQGTTRSLYSANVPTPVEGLLHIEVGAYLGSGSTTPWAGEFAVYLNGARYAADTVRSHSHGRAGMIYVSGAIDLALYAGVIHAVDVRYTADASTAIAPVELFDGHVTVSASF